MRPPRNGRREPAQPESCGAGAGPGRSAPSTEKRSGIGESHAAILEHLIRELQLVPVDTTF